MFTKISEESLFEGYFLKIHRATYSSSDGTRFAREYVVHPGAVTVVPVTSDGEVLALWQFRVPMGREIFEVCAGKRDVAGEPPHLTAARELAEELGLRATSLVQLGTFFNSPGFCDEETIVFGAFGLESVARSPQGVEEELMRRAHFPLARLPQLLQTGALTDAKTMISLAMVERYLGTEEGRAIFKQAEGSAMVALWDASDEDASPSNGT